MQKEFGLLAPSERAAKYSEVTNGPDAAYDDYKTAGTVPLAAAAAARLLAPEAKSAGCAAADQRELPAAGEWAELPVYLAPTYVDAAGVVQGQGTGRCYAQRAPTAWIVFERDAYRRCAWANKHDAALAKTALEAAKVAGEAAVVAAKASADAGKLDADCLAAAGLDPATGAPLPTLGTAALVDAAKAAWRACPVNAACEAAAITATRADLAALALCPARQGCQKDAGRDATARGACLALDAPQLALAKLADAAALAGSTGATAPVVPTTTDTTGQTAPTAPTD